MAMEAARTGPGCHSAAVFGPVTFAFSLHMRYVYAHCQERKPDGGSPGVDGDG